MFYASNGTLFHLVIDSLEVPSKTVLCWTDCLNPSVTATTSLVQKCSDHYVQGWLLSYAFLGCSELWSLAPYSQDNSTAFQCGRCCWLSHHGCILSWNQTDALTFFCHKISHPFPLCFVLCPSSSGKGRQQLWVFTSSMCIFFIPWLTQLFHQQWNIQILQTTSWIPYRYIWCMFFTANLPS